MSDAFDERRPSLNNSGAIHSSVPTPAGAVIVMLREWLRNTLVSPKSAMRAEKSLSIKMLLYGPSALSQDQTAELNLRFSNLREQTASRGDTSVHELCPPAVGGRIGSYFRFERTLTSFNRLVSGHAVTKSMIVPCSIHSEIIIRVCGVLVAPSSGNRFGCLNCFHSTTSWQNFYFPCQHIRILKERCIEGGTLSTLAGFGLWRIRLIATLEPRYHPQNTSALPPLPDGNSSTRSSSSVMAYEDGNNLYLQHIFLSTIENVSRSEAHRPESSREPLFTLVSCDERRLIRTHLLQIVDDPTRQLACQIIQQFLPALARQLVLDIIEDVAVTL